MPHKFDNLDKQTDFLKTVHYQTDSRRIEILHISKIIQKINFF